MTWFFPQKNGVWVQTIVEYRSYNGFFQTSYLEETASHSSITNFLNCKSVISFLSFFQKRKKSSGVSKRCIENLRSFSMSNRRKEALVRHSEANAKRKISRSNKSELCNFLSYIEVCLNIWVNFTLILLKKSEYCK